MMTNMMNTQQYNFQPHPDVHGQEERGHGHDGGRFIYIGPFNYQNFPRHYHQYLWSYVACANISNKCHSNSK